MKTKHEKIEQVRIECSAAERLAIKPSYLAQGYTLRDDYTLQDGTQVLCFERIKVTHED